MGKAKQVLYQQAHQRIERCLKIGAHIEAVALIESIMSDRIESALVAPSGNQLEASTLGSLVSRIDKIEPMPTDLKRDILVWNKSRAFVVHQMVKLTNDHGGEWNERIAFARRTAREGQDLLKVLRRYTDLLAPKRKSQKK